MVQLRTTRRCHDVDSYYDQRCRPTTGTIQSGTPLHEAHIDLCGRIATATAAEPNPMHMILYSCEYKDSNLGLNLAILRRHASKRIQAYYRTGAARRACLLVVQAGISE